jgi:hypothetical protein
MSPSPKLSEEIHAAVIEGVRQAFWQIIQSADFAATVEEAVKRAIKGAAKPFRIPHTDRAEALAGALAPIEPVAAEPTLETAPAAAAEEAGGIDGE